MSIIQCTESESSRQEEEEDSEDDLCPDYVNINEQGFPLTGAEFEKKLTNYENFNPLSFDLVHGHMYDRPDEHDQLSSENKTSPHTKSLHPTQNPAAEALIWPSDPHPESEAKSQRRFTNQTIVRKTYDNVLLSPTKTKIRPLPPPKPTGQQLARGSPSISRTRSVSARVNWLNQEQLQARSTFTNHR